MAEVRPLRGIRYVQDTVGDLAQVLTPPYDVIDKEAQERYYARSPYNSIRLELGKEQATDNVLNNVYTRAAATFSEWRMQNVLRQESAPCYYLYQQVFTHGDQTYTRTSLLARVRLEPWSTRVVLPHEHTLAKAKNDRLHLLQACAANFSPIMSLYDDPQGRMRRLLNQYSTQAEVCVVDEVGEQHLLHPVTDAQQIALIEDFFAQRQLYIADGHHRYETALAYRDSVHEQRHELSPADAVNFVLMALTDVDDPGLLVLPTHRMLFGLSEQALSELSEQRLGQYFTLKLLDSEATDEQVLAQLAQAGREQLTLLLATNEHRWLLLLNEQGRRRMELSEHSAAWNRLDVAVAHTLVLEELLGLQKQDLTAGTHVYYTRDAREALQGVQAGTVQLALLLNATRVQQICDVARADDRMPQKSTYFYPKLITGLVINPLW
ncbi:MAG: DUF1015 domain-containing protein [Ktedonobacteraceae bacterium]|nr:DUF1015 domain-containing protein [Ktedonobacteraceae bacterium]